MIVNINHDKKPWLKNFNVTPASWFTLIVKKLVSFFYEIQDNTGLRLKS